MANNYAVVRLYIRHVPKKKLVQRARHHLRDLIIASKISPSRCRAKDSCRARKLSERAAAHSNGTTSQPLIQQSLETAAVSPPKTSIHHISTANQFPPAASSPTRDPRPQTIRAHIRVRARAAWSTCLCDSPYSGKDTTAEL